MDLRNLFCMFFFLAMIIACSSTSTRRPIDEGPQLEAPTMPSHPIGPPLETIPKAAIGDGTALDNPLTFFIHSSIRGAFGPSCDGAPINGGIPFPNSITSIPDVKGENGVIDKKEKKKNNNNNYYNEELDAQHLTVIAGDMTEGPETGSNVVGKVDGFAVEATRDDWTSATVAFTAQFKEGEYADTISFFGVLQRAPEAESHLAVAGGTGRYASAKGSAKLHPMRAVEQSAGEGVGMPPVRVTVNLDRSK